MNANRFFWDSWAGQTTYIPLWDRMEGAWLWTLDALTKSGKALGLGLSTTYANRDRIPRGSPPLHNEQ